ncbi:hypothetical protein [Actinacidiphila oryziradicis]|uniref:hypothetical protein n=1 Tax=Actinacidiphila oryziradicis TaxID=2571141 RepID=UPI0023F1DF83|nr:hypothetical protein [Actinacidiphila oryziradicis]MCW2875514.1 putative rane protein [Actinacidiphila oryziradicis]
MNAPPRSAPGAPGTGKRGAHRRQDPVRSRGEGALLHLTAPPRQRRPSWSDDPLDELAERLADVCGAAVHPDEIAAVLESDGLTHEQITSRYARRDLFDVADELYARVPRRFPDPEPAPDPWRTSPWRCLLRGVLFGLPGIAYVLGTGLLPGRPGGLAASALVAWGWNQALAHRAYVRLGTGGRRAAARCLMLAAPAGAAVAAAALPVAGGTGAGLAFAAGQALYLAAATALLVLGRERDLLLALAPTAAGALCVPLWDPGPVAVTGLLVGTVAAAALLAVREIVRSLRAPDSRAPGLPRLAASVPYGLFGLGCGALTLMAPAAGRSAAIVLTLSMGVAEWLLYRYRSLALAALRRSRSAGGFRFRAARVLVLCLAGYLALLTAPALATGAPLGPLLALGSVLWIGLLLQAVGIAWPSAVACLAAAGAEAVLLGLAFPHPALGPAAVQLAACGCAAAALLAVACTRLGRTTAHR